MMGDMRGAPRKTTDTALALFAAAALSAGGWLVGTSSTDTGPAPTQYQPGVTIHGTPGTTPTTPAHPEETPLAI